MEADEGFESRRGAWQGQRRPAPFRSRLSILSGFRTLQSLETTFRHRLIGALAALLIVLGGDPVAAQRPPATDSRFFGVRTTPIVQG
ncbi:MAG: hypothetical protein ACKV22_41210, partial [Bryobacteraceae bacterium]